MADDGAVYGDGRNSLARESKVGALVQLVLSALIGAGLTWAANLDTSSWTGVAGQVGAGLVAAAGGLAVAYRTANR